MPNPEILFAKDRQQRIKQADVAAESKNSKETMPMIVGSSARYAEAALGGVVYGKVVG
jgi:hypothetical protein